jgi:hypothetical protein
MAYQPPFFSARRQDQRLLPSILKTTITTPSGTIMPLNSGPRKLGTKAYYVDHNSQEQAADLWDSVKQIS